MSGSLQTLGDDGPPRCSFCGAEAAGPCARCRAMLCGDCCVITEGGASPHAICPTCERRSGRSLRPAWVGLLSWLGLILLALVGLNLLASWASTR